MNSGLCRYYLRLIRTCGLPDDLRVFPPRLDRRKAEVADFHREVIVMKEDVVALQVAVDNILGMEVASRVIGEINMCVCVST